MIKVAVIKKKNVYIFYTLCGILIFILFTYFYLLNKTILDAVYVEVQQKKQVELGSKMAVLENAYLIESSSLTLDRAYSSGFVDDKKPYYLSLKNFPEALSLAEKQ